MNKLRELIAKEKENHRKDGDPATNSVINLAHWLVIHSLDIRDLIEAATECSLMATGSVDECISKLHRLDDALSKLEK